MKILSRIDLIVAGLVSLMMFTVSSFAAEQRVFFANMKDGDVVKSPFTVQMGVEGMEVKPLGTPKDGEGHHHLIINGTSVEKGKVVPADEKHLHFGKGQTETSVSLAPGDYTLTLQFANGVHESYGPALSNTIHIKVAE